MPVARKKAHTAWLVRMCCLHMAVMCLNEFLKPSSMTMDMCLKEFLKPSSVAMDTCLSEFLKPSSVAMDMCLNEFLKPSSVAMDMCLSEFLKPSSVAMDVCLNEFLKPSSVAMDMCMNFGNHQSMAMEMCTYSRNHQVWHWGKLWHSWWDSHSSWWMHISNDFCSCAILEWKKIQLQNFFFHALLIHQSLSSCSYTLMACIQTVKYGNWCVWIPETIKYGTDEKLWHLWDHHHLGGFTFCSCSKAINGFCSFTILESKIQFKELFFCTLLAH